MSAGADTTGRSLRSDASSPRESALPDWLQGAWWLPLTLIAVTFAAMLAFSWGKWPDVLVDYGHELYVAWQISQGKALVRDFFFSNTGPLSPYLNALLFWTFGPGLRVLVLFNLLLLALLTWILYRLLEALAGRLAATVGCLVLLVLFAFGQYVGIGNYNYVTPYSHGVTHGLLLSLLCLWLAYEHLRTGAIWHLVGSALCWGAAFLTKPEVFVACCAGLLPAFALLLRRSMRDRRWRRAALAAGGGALLAPCVAFLLLTAQLGPAQGLRATVLPWMFLSTPGTQIPFYAVGLGIDDAGRSLGLMARWAGWYALALAPAAFLDAHLPPRWGLRGWAPAAVFVLILAALRGLVSPAAWYDVARPLPLVAIGGAALYFARLLRAPAESKGAARLALGAMLWLLSLALLLKMALNTRIYHYGFALAMPATVMLVATLTGCLPGWLRRRGGAGSFFQGVAAALLVAMSAAYVQIAAGYFSDKVFQVGEGLDAFMADARGKYVADVMQALSRDARPDATLAVLPEGVMINYLTRRVNPTPFIEYMPDALAWTGGEAPLLATYQQSPPDLVLLVHRDTTEHGATFFGRDYAHATMFWISQIYTPVALFGDPPLQDGGYGMLLLARSTGTR